MYKYKTIFLLSITSIFFLSPALFNLAIDPFQFFRKPVFRSNIFSNNQRYQMAGLIKNYDFESIIAGTSMSERITSQQVKNTLNWQNPIKLCITGIKPKNLNLVLDFALTTKKVNKLLLDLHWYFISSDPNETNVEYSFPSYLYSNNLDSKLKYLFNSGVFEESKNLFSSTLNSDFENYAKTIDQINLYPNEFEFQNYASKNNLNKLKNKVIKKRNSFNIKQVLDTKTKFPSIEQNLIPLLKKHPNTHFYIYLPPYSTYHYATDNRYKNLLKILHMKKYIVLRTSNLNNVTIYGFDDVLKIVNNVLNYKDYGHYKTHVHQYILDSIRENNHVLNTSNIDSYLETVVKNINNYELKF